LISLLLMPLFRQPFHVFFFFEDYSSAIFAILIHAFRHFFDADAITPV